MTGLTDNTYIAINHSFNAIRLFKNTFTPTKFHLKIYCNPHIRPGLTYEESVRRGGASYQIALFWLQNVLDNVMIVNPCESIGDFIYHVADNSVMFTPGEPDDNILARLIHCKIGAISKGNLELGGIIIRSEDTYNTERYWEGTDYLLPDSSYTGKEIIHAEPWWMRPVIDIAEFYKEDQSEEEIDEILNSPDVLADFEQSILDEGAEDEDSEAEIIEDIWNR